MRSMDQEVHCCIVGIQWDRVLESAAAGAGWIWHFVIDITVGSANPVACSCMQTWMALPLVPCAMSDQFYPDMRSAKTAVEYFEVHLLQLQDILLVGHQVLNKRCRCVCVLFLPSSSPR